MDNKEQLADSETGMLITVTLQRGAVVGDMVAAFGDPEVMRSKLYFCRHMFQPHGEVDYEQGIVCGFKEVLDHFWAEFTTNMTTGNKLRVPALQPEFPGWKWEGVGRIICKGWTDFNYLPPIAPAFIESAIYGDTKLDKKEAFLQWIPEAEREVLQAVLHRFPTDLTQLRGIFRKYRCPTPPTEENLPRLLAGLCHVEFVQRPCYAAISMRQVLRSVFRRLSRKKFLALYDTPSPRK